MQKISHLKKFNNYQNKKEKKMTKILMAYEGAYIYAPSYVKFV
jgi:hypothetical protein